MSIVKKIIILIVSFVYYMGSSFANIDITDGLLFSPERIIYKESEKKGVSTMLENANNEAILVQSQIIAANEKTLKPLINKESDIFLITPPLHRLDSGVCYSWKIQRVADGNLAKDRESVFYVSLKTIPEVSDKNTSEFIITPTLYFKMLYRPKAIEELRIDKEVDKMRFSINKNKLMIKNPSALSITLTSLTIGSYKVPMKLIDDSFPPFSENQIELPQSVSGEVTWQALNEYGLITKLSIGVLDESIL
ncbi:fimbrial biogenesis chaperone [Providencia vermicola]|uniref:fimbrial biogenesis chaperone n=1 Tax=Providencia vermicola TaxID=333965 RepID=UPI0034E3A131